MGFLEVFGMWIFAISLVFMFLPIAQVKEWRARGTTEGFSAVHLLLPVLMMGCWLRHGLMTGDSVNIYINLMGVVSCLCYLAAFAYYTKNRSTLYAQVGALAATLLAIFAYVGTLSAEEAPHAMGKIAAVSQNAGLFGGIYQIKTVISRKTTEYMPASMQYAILFVLLQWLTFGVLSGNVYMVVSRIPGLIVSLVSISLYVIYPPITWRVPILGTQQAQEKKNE